MIWSRIVGTGSCLPAKIVTNDDLAKRMDTSDEWIRTRTGIRQRHIAEPTQTSSDLGAEASRQALSAAGVTASEIDLIIVATATPDYIFPSTACIMQTKLGIKGCTAFDIQAVCSGFVYALAIADKFIRSGQTRCALVVGAEVYSRILDWNDRSTAVLFGDGAGATLMRKATGTRGILGSYMKSDGTLAELLYRPGGGASHPPSEELLKDHSYYIKMAGREVFKAAVLSMADACDQALKRAGLTGADVDLLIPHQANIRIIEATAKHAGLPMDKVYVNVDRFGNTSAASIAIALDEAVKTGRLQPGMTVLFCAFGAGFTWAAMAVRW